MLGILFFYNIKFQVKYLLIIIFILALIIMYLIIKNKQYVLILLIITFIISGLIMKEKSESKLCKYQNIEIKMEGILLETEYLSKGYSKYIMEVKKIYYNKIGYILNERVVLRVFGNKKVKIGDKILATGTVKIAESNTNPKLFNYRLYLYTKDIFYTVEVRSENIKVISSDNLNYLQKNSIKFKEKTGYIFDKIISKKRNASIVKAMVLGDTKYITDNDKNIFREAGLAHILAVSGLHIGIIGGAVAFLLKALKLKLNLQVLITLFILWIYGYFIGFPISTLRALIMITLLLLSKLIHRSYDPINILSFAALVLLIYNPFWLFSIGFQLSFGATYSIILFTSKIKEKIPLSNDIIPEILSPILGVQMGLLPFLIYHFNKFSFLSIVSNIVVIPLISIVLILAFTGLIIFFISARLAIFLGFIINTLLWVCNIIISLIYKLGFTIDIVSFKIYEIFIYYLIVFIMLGFIKLKLYSYKVKKVIFIYYLVAILLIFTNSYYCKNVYIDFIDVGQGDCTLIRGRGRDILIDTGGTPFGNYDIGANVVTPYLLKTGIKNIDGVFISHYHEDHCEGVLSLIERISIDNIFLGYKNNKSPLYTEILKKAKENKVNINYLNKGDIIKIDNNIKIKVLHPEINNTREYMENENNLSMVLLVSINEYKVLFTGDIESEVEKELINNKVYEDIDIIKAPHHGSNTSSIDKFVEKFNPEYVIIQVGKNKYGHPNKEVLSRYSSNGIKVFRNDKNGLVRVKIEKNNINITPFLKDKDTINDIINKYKILILVTLVFNLVSIYFIKSLRYNEKSEIVDNSKT